MHKVKLLLIWLCLSPLGVKAQEPSAPTSGPLHTTVIEVPPEVRSSGRDSVLFSIEPSEGVQLLGPQERIISTQRSRIPISFFLSSRFSAGTHIIGDVTFALPGLPLESSIRFAVPASSSFALAARLLQAVIEPGEKAFAFFTLANTGNTTDTITVSLSPPMEWASGASQVHVLAPGIEISDSIPFTVTASEKAGERTMVLLTASSSYDVEESRLRPFVTRENKLLEGFAHIPSEIFVGATGDVLSGESSGVPFSISGSGSLPGNFDIDYSYRHFPTYQSRHLLTALMPGRSKYLEVSHPLGSVFGGEIYTGQMPFTGRSSFGDGIGARIRPGNYEGEIYWMFAPPSLTTSEGERGHTLFATTDVPFHPSAAAVSLSVIDQSLPHSGGMGKLQSGGVSVEGEVGAEHTYQLETAWLHASSPDSEAVSGPLVDASYNGQFEKLNLYTRVRKIPELSSARTPIRGDQALVSTSYNPLSWLSLVAHGYKYSLPLPDSLQGQQNEAYSGGVRFSRNSSSLDVRGQYSETSLHSPVTGSRERLRRSVVSSLRTPLGPLALYWLAEAGEHENRESTNNYWNTRASLGYYLQNTFWMRAGYQYTSDSFASSQHHLELNTGANIGSLSLRAGGNTSLGGPFADDLNVWGSAFYRLVPGLELFAGGEYTSSSFSTESNSIFMGFKKSLDIPTPIPEASAVRGVVFEDLNANRIQDPGEPGLGGITLTYGPLTTTSDPAGIFEFEDAPLEGARLMISSKDLPGGLIVPSDYRIPQDGMARIPLLRVASLQVRVFIDANENNEKDEEEDWSTNALLYLTGSRDRLRTASVQENGTAYFPALEHGLYKLEVVVPQQGGGSRLLATREVEVDHGEETVIQVGVEETRRQIRIQTIPPGSP